MRLTFFRRQPKASARAEQEAWIEWMRLSNVADSTIRSYRRTTNLLLARWPELKLADFTDEHIIGVIDDAGPRSRQSRRSAFANLFAWAFRTKRIPFNPMHHVPGVRQPPREPVETFTEAEVKVLCALPEPDGTLMAVLFGTGARKAEACHLQVRRCDLEHAEIHIVSGAKNGVAGVIPIEHRLVQRLAEYFLLEGLNEGDYLWYCHPGGQTTRRHDRPLVAGSMHAWWARCVEASGVRYRNLHVTRHTFATEWRRRGLSMDDVSFMLRHADPRTTARVYVHTTAVDIKRRMLALEPAQ